VKISYNWLKQYCNVKNTPEEVSKMLTDCGLEVESLEKFQSVKGGLESIVIGEVKTKIQHPNADRLSVTTVNIGGENDLQIVCGASNVAAGQKVVIATVGAMLYPTTGEPFQIGKSKIRGEASEGMICAEDEVGLGDSHVGIIVLDNDAVVGTPASQYFKIEDDIVFEIGLTPNRVDASSHIGVARDLVAILHTLGVSSDGIKMPDISAFKVDNNNKKIAVQIDDVYACPRYTGVTINNITVNSSPEWLQNRLKAVGIKPINNIVDVTNFVLQESGQPLHAFDTATIKGDKIIVKKLAAGTKFTTLDEVERTLTADDLMICNGDGVGMCMAGVYGGLQSGVKSTTTSVFIESAYFNPIGIRRTSKHHNLKTDAAFRFERGTDPEATMFALKRAALLIKEIAGGEISSEIIDIYPNPVKPFSVSFNYKNCDRLIGLKIDRAVIKQIITSLGIEIINENEDGLSLAVPVFKVDVKREVDVIEEVLRIYGYNNIPMSNTIHASLSYSQKPDKERVQNAIADLLSNSGFNEIMSTSLTRSTYVGNVEFLKTEHNVLMLNPLSQDLDALRQSMLFCGLDAITYNKNRRNADLKLYEFGKTYHKYNDKYQEDTHLALFITGRKAEEQWNTNKDGTDFFHLKAFVNNILQKAGIVSGKYNINQSVISNDIFSEGMAYTVNKKVLLTMGKVKKSLIKTFDADINWDNFIALLSKNEIEYKEVSKFPEVRRDLSMLVNKETQFKEIEQQAYQQERSLLKNVNLFDVYEGDKIEQGKKSYAVSFTLLDEEKTLTDKQIEKTMERIMQGLEKNLGVQIRK
jgi:phenylalanyl-tRNA synthetase beta chain